MGHGRFALFPYCACGDAREIGSQRGRGQRQARSNEIVGGIADDHLVQIPNLDCNSALASHKGGTSLRSMSQSFSWAFLATLSAAPLIAPFALPIVFCTSPLAS
jgi:hypothetical protein